MSRTKDNREDRRRKPFVRPSLKKDENWTLRSRTGGMGWQNTWGHNCGRGS